MDSLEKPGKIQQKMHGFPRKTWKIHRKCMDSLRKLKEDPDELPRKPRDSEKTRASIEVIWKFAEDPWMPSSEPQWNNCEPSNM